MLSLLLVDMVYCGLIVMFKIVRYVGAILRLMSSSEGPDGRSRILGVLLYGADMRWKGSYADSDSLDSKVRDEKIEIEVSILNLKLKWC